MKGSKTLGKSIAVIVLSLVLMISAIVPMAVMGSENYGGSKGSPLGSYRYYSVKSGETIDSIAEKNGVTVSDIMTYNNMTSETKLYRGQIIKLPVTTANSSSHSLVSTKITMKAKQANATDVISAIAYNAGYTVIYKGVSDEKVDVDLVNVTPLKAIDFVTRMVGLSFIKDGSTIMVASAAELNSTFVDSIALTKLSLKYITYDELMTQASALGLTDIQMVSQSSNKRNIWISTFPKQMAKLHELIGILDVRDNIMTGSSSIAAAFTPIELKYISASEFSGLLGNLGLHQGITLGCRPMTLFVYVSGTALADIMTIKKVIDVPASAQSKPGSLPGGNPATPGTSVPVTPQQPGGTTPTPPVTPPVPGTPVAPDPTPQTIMMEKYDLKNITRADAESLIGQYAPGVKIYGHDRMTKSLWLFGTAEQIANAKSVVSQIDSSVVSPSSTVHTYTAQNCSVEELMARFDKVKHEEVNIHTYDHPEISNTLIVYCDDVTWNNEIHELLVTLDTVDTGTAMWLPLESNSGNDVSTVETVLNNRYNVMLSLYPEVFSGVEHKVVTLADGDQTKGVMYIKASSDKVTRMKNLMSAFDNA